MTTGDIRRSVGRPARISRDEIADAALAIGLRDVTLKSIAARLGVDHSSLYRHVSNRDDLVFAAADRAIATLDWERDSNDWRTYISAAAEAVWDLYQQNPGLAEAIRTMDRTPPAGIRAFSRACFHLETHGFAMEDAALIMDSVMDMTNDSASLWERLAREGRDGEVAMQRLRESWSIETKDQSIAYVHFMQALLDGEPKDWWHRKLALLIHGAEALQKTRRR